MRPPNILGLVTTVPTVYQGLNGECGGWDRMPEPVTPAGIVISNSLRSYSPMAHCLLKVSPSLREAPPLQGAVTQPGHEGQSGQPWRITEECV